MSVGLGTEVNLEGMSPDVLNQAKHLTDGLQNDRGVLKSGGGEGQGVGANSPKPNAQQGTQQDGGNPIKEAFNKIPIIGGLLYRLFNAIFKLFGYDLDEMGKEMGRGNGMSMADAFDQIKGNAPEWAKGQMQGLQQDFQNLVNDPLNYKKHLDSMSEKVGTMIKDAKKQGVDTRNLEKVQTGLNKMAHGGPIGKLFGLKAVKEGFEGLKGQYEKGELTQEMPSKIDPSRDANFQQEMGKIGADIGGKLESGLSTQELDERRGSFFKEDQVKEDKRDLKDGLEAIERGDKGPGSLMASTALKDLESGLGDKDREAFREEAGAQLRAMKEKGQSAGETFDAITESFDKYKGQQQSKAEAAKETGGKSDDDLEAAAQEAGETMSKHTTGGAQEADAGSNKSAEGGHVGGGKGQEVGGGGRE